MGFHAVAHQLIGTSTDQWCRDEAKACSPDLGIRVVCFDLKIHSLENIQLAFVSFFRSSVKANLSLEGASLDPKLPQASIQPNLKILEN